MMFLKTLRSTALLRTRTPTSGRPKPTPSSTVERPRRLARAGVAGLLVDGRHAQLAAGELEPVHCLEGRLSRLELEVPAKQKGKGAVSDQPSTTSAARKKKKKRGKRTGQSRSPCFCPSSSPGAGRQTQSRQTAQTPA